MTDGVQHAPDLTVSALTDGDIEDRGSVVQVPLDYDDLGWRRESVLQRDACLQVGDREIVHEAANDGSVGPRDHVRRVQELLGEISIVRQDEDPCCIGVQTPDGIDAFLHATQELHDRVRRVGIANRRHIPGWLVEKKVCTTGDTWQPMTVNANLISFRVRLGSRLRYWPTVDRHTPRAHQRLGGPSRGHARVGEELLNALIHRGKVRQQLLYRAHAM